MDLQQYKYPELSICTHSVESKQQITPTGRQIHPSNSDQYEQGSRQPQDCENSLYINTFAYFMITLTYFVSDITCPI